MGKFKVTKVTSLKDLNLGDELPESDYSVLREDDTFLQMQYIEEEEDLVETPVEPGLFTIVKTPVGLRLQHTTFVNDSILEDFTNTKSLEKITDAFFSKFDIYKKYGIEVPKRAVLMYGPPGTSKTTSLQTMTKRYVADNETFALVWATDKYDPATVKDLIKSFKYSDKVKKMILIAEDIGGTEIDQVRMRSDSSLLSLLDNKEKTFKIPVLIFGTTNHPEVFMGSITNRPDRFDDKIEFGYPNAQQRINLLKFFLKEQVTKEMIELMESNKCAEFTPAHIRDIPLRMELFDKSGETVILDLANDLETFKKNFTKKKSMGLSLYDED